MITFEQLMLENGYQVKTTFWMDFSIADQFGIDAIKDTYNIAFNEWKSNVEYVTELVIVLNHKIWQWHTKDEEVARTYDTLWRQTDEWCCDNLKGKDAEYYFCTTD